MARRKLPSAFPQLHVSDLSRRGCLSLGARGQKGWRLNGKLLLVAHEMTAEGLVLKYADAEAVIAIKRTPQHLGGQRPWFECYWCWRRCAILYGAPFICRECRDITYASQKRSPDTRQMDKCFALRRAAGEEANAGCLFDPFPERPHGMHRSTYFRLSARYAVAEDQHWRNTSVMAGRMLARFDARHERISGRR